MLKNLIAKFLMITVLIFSLGGSSLTAYAETQGQDVQLNNLLDTINSTSDVDELIQKAKLGVDDLSEKRGDNFNVLVEYEGAFSKGRNS